jgi:hypothetical protein
MRKLLQFAFPAILPLIALSWTPAGTALADETLPPGFQQIAMTEAAPEIELRAPADGGTYTSPVGIDIAFHTKEGAEVDLESLKVTVVSETMLGTFEVDNTDDISEFASPDGIYAPDADIPAGRHKVTIHVADNQNRVAQRELSITVREPSVLERRND